MDASAFTVKPVPDIAAGQLFYMSGGWWLKAVTQGQEPVQGAMCVVGPEQGQWDCTAEQTVITIADDWECFADVSKPIAPVAGMAPAGSLGLMTGTLLVVGFQCAIRLDHATLHYVQGGVKALHFRNWSAMVRRLDGSNNADDLFNVVNSGD
ncbi:hypothetical protein KV692_04855 [Xanthomonas euvesicatoria pv. physalidis]|uniref:hypothetical protein n=1 Tax=Xanthomonas euvesicatoria TaxID=456327 RepID=UPI001C440C60|nr:hypothetical protein [Xanthomonas euvesicatoria]MBV6687222.1 hypothetical protein [Xanthomonas euvesicatoria pv. physalidis]